MGRTRLRLHHRIVIPFALIAVVATSATAYVAFLVTSAALEARVRAQILNAATLITQSDFALNVTILSSVKAIAGADVVTFESDGDVLASTLGSAQSRAVVDGLRTVGLPQSDQAPTLHRALCPEPCDVAYQRVRTRPNTFVAVVTGRTEVMAATRAVTNAILVSAGLSLLGMVIVSQFVARRVTAPIDDLVAFTREAGAGDVTRRAKTGDDEIGGLGQAFNDMLDRVDQSRAALVQSEKLGLAGLFAARVAHDIRNPLASIKIQAQLLRARLGTASDRQTLSMVDAVQRDVVQVESVVRDLLELARPGELKLESSRLGAIIDDALVHVGPYLTYRKIRIHTQVADPLPNVSLDGARFKQALLNVVSNAAEAMPNGGNLTLSASFETDTDQVRLDICDDGTGIDPDILPKVFDPFVSTKRDGMGLGLVNVKSVIDNHGGRIELAPLPSRGTRVSIWLPVNSGQHG